MDNVLINKQKRFLQWTVQAPSTIGSTIVSETFLLQNRVCNLKFYTGNRNVSSPYVNFECNGKVQPPVDATFHVVSNSKTFANLCTTITSTNHRLWKYENEYQITNREFIFELIFYADFSYGYDDKTVQTPSYIDNRFLMDGVSQDFSKILSENSCHDLEFICEDQTIKAHKSVLSCRSDVFASMLQSDMVEGKTGRVNIQEMDATLFRQFLGCLYTGVLPTLTVDTAQHFYVAADKYNISSLKKQCAEFLNDNLSPENAYDILLLADRHSDPDLKKNVIDFMVKEKIPYSDEKWTEFSQKKPALAIEVLNVFFQHHLPK